MMREVGNRGRCLAIGVINDKDFEQHSRIKTDNVGKKRKWEKEMKRGKFNLYTNFSTIFKNPPKTEKWRYLIPILIGIKMAKEMSVWRRLSFKKKAVAGLVTGICLINER